MSRFFPIPILLLGLALGCTDEPTAAPPAVPTEAAWPYESLTAEERAVIDRGRSAAGWDRVHQGFARAVLQQHARSKR